MSTTLIFIPGMKGFRLLNRREGRLVWKLPDPDPRYLHELELSWDPETKRFVNAHNVEIVPGELEPHIYSAFYSLLKSQNPQVSLFSYDWRLPSLETAENLLKFLVQTPTKSFGIVTHSLGAFPLLAALADRRFPLERLAYLVLVSPPLEGAPAALEAMLRGKDIEETIPAALKHDMRSISRGFPTMYELLPVYPEAFLANTPGFSLLEPQYWQSNIRNRDLTHLENVLDYAQRFRRVVSPRNRVLTQRLRELNSEGRCLALTGTGTPTLSRIKVTAGAVKGISNYLEFAPAKAGQPTGTLLEEGDGRVPLRSLREFAAQLPTLILGSEKQPLDHVSILTSPQTKVLLEKIPKSAEYRFPGWWKQVVPNVRRLQPDSE